MADRDIPRSISRRGTWSARIIASQSPPRRSTRTTRSQSRDISDSEENRNNVRVRRRARQAPLEGALSAPGSSKNPKGRDVNTRALQELSIVQEESSVNYPGLRTEQDEDGGNAIEADRSAPKSMNSNSKSPGGLSAFPGTPARTSLSAQELADVSPMEMLDALPDLSAAADKLLDFVIPSDISEASIASLMTQVQTKDSRVEPRLTRLGKTLQAQRDVYGGASYINIGETFNRLLGGKIGIADDRIATATWRPEPLLQKANLAKLALRVLGLPAHSQKSIFVEELAQAFPLPFVQKFLPVGSMTPGSSSLSVETLELALEIRTQEAIMILDRHTGQPNFDSDVLLTQIFFKNAKTLRGWGIEGLMVSEEIRGCIVQRVENLRSAFKDTAAMSPGNQKWGVELLKTIFSWNSFAHHIIGWTHQRLAEIRDQTASYGGVKAICASLHEEMQSGRLVTDFTDDNSPQIEIDYDTPSEAVSEHQSLQKNTSQRENFSMAQFSSDSPKARMLVAHLKRREAVRKASRLNEQTSIAQNQISTPDVQVASTVEPSPRAQTPQAEINGPSVPSPAPVNIPSPPENFAQDHEDEAADSLRGNPRDDYRDDFADVVSTGRKILAESNKENIAEDIEPQRTRTSKKGSLLDRQSVAHRISFEDSQRPSSNGQSSQNSEDEEFQQHNQTLDIAERRAMKPLAKHRSSELARSQRQSAKRARVHEPNCERNLQGSTNGVGEERENILPPSQKMTQYTNVNQLAKEKKVMMEPKRPQTRQPWSEEETGVLLDLIGEYGTSWKLLKDRDFLEDNVLEGRDQVALKDKARNMKLDYLKSGKFLPRNFEKISISKLQIDQLRKRNIEYDPETGKRTDADVEGYD